MNKAAMTEETLKKDNEKDIEKEKCKEGSSSFNVQEFFSDSLKKNFKNCFKGLDVVKNRQNSERRTKMALDLKNAVYHTLRAHKNSPQTTQKKQNSNGTEAVKANTDNLENKDPKTTSNGSPPHTVLDSDITSLASEIQLGPQTVDIQPQDPDLESIVSPDDKEATGQRSSRLTSCEDGELISEDELDVCGTEINTEFPNSNEENGSKETCGEDEDLVITTEVEPNERRDSWEVNADNVEYVQSTCLSPVSILGNDSFEVVEVLSSDDESSSDDNCRNRNTNSNSSLHEVVTTNIETKSSQSQHENMVNNTRTPKKRPSCDLDQQSSESNQQELNTKRQRIEETSEKSVADVAELDVIQTEVNNYNDQANKSVTESASTVTTPTSPIAVTLSETSNQTPISPEPICLLSTSEKDAAVELSTESQSSESTQSDQTDTPPHRDLTENDNTITVIQEIGSDSSLNSANEQLPQVMLSDSPQIDSNDNANRTDDAETGDTNISNLEETESSSISITAPYIQNTVNETVNESPPSLSAESRDLESRDQNGAVDNPSTDCTGEIDTSLSTTEPGPIEENCGTQYCLMNELQADSIIEAALRAANIQDTENELGISNDNNLMQQESMNDSTESNNIGADAGNVNQTVETTSVEAGVENYALTEQQQPNHAETSADAEVHSEALTDSAICSTATIRTELDANNFDEQTVEVPLIRVRTDIFEQDAEADEVDFDQPNQNSHADVVTADSRFVDGLPTAGIETIQGVPTPMTNYGIQDVSTNILYTAASSNPVAISEHPTSASTAQTTSVSNTTQIGTNTTAPFNILSNILGTPSDPATDGALKSIHDILIQKGKALISCAEQFQSPMFNLLGVEGKKAAINKARQTIFDLFANLDMNTNIIRQHNPHLGIDAPPLINTDIEIEVAELVAYFEVLFDAMLFLKWPKNSDLAIRGVTHTFIVRVIRILNFFMVVKSANHDEQEGKFRAIASVIMASDQTSPVFQMIQDTMLKAKFLVGLWDRVKNSGSGPEYEKSAAVDFNTLKPAGLLSRLGKFKKHIVRKYGPPPNFICRDNHSMVLIQNPVQDVNQSNSGPFQQQIQQQRQNQVQTGHQPGIVVNQIHQPATYQNYGQPVQQSIQNQPPASSGNATRAQINDALVNQCLTFAVPSSQNPYYPQELRKSLTTGQNSSLSTASSSLRAGNYQNQHQTSHLQQQPPPYTETLQQTQSTQYSNTNATNPVTNLHSQPQYLVHHGTPGQIQQAQCQQPSQQQQQQQTYATNATASNNFHFLQRQQQQRQQRQQVQQMSVNLGYHQTQHLNSQQPHPVASQQIQPSSPYCRNTSQQQTQQWSGQAAQYTQQSASQTDQISQQLTQQMAIQQQYQRQQQMQLATQQQQQRQSTHSHLQQQQLTHVNQTHQQQLQPNPQLHQPQNQSAHLNQTNHIGQNTSQSLHQFNTQQTGDTARTFSNQVQLTQNFQPPTSNTGVASYSTTAVAEVTNSSDNDVIFIGESAPTTNPRTQSRRGHGVAAQVSGRSPAQSPGQTSASPSTTHSAQTLTFYAASRPVSTSNSNPVSPATPSGAPQGVSLNESRRRSSSNRREEQNQNTLGIQQTSSVGNATVDPALTTGNLSVSSGINLTLTPMQILMNRQRARNQEVSTSTQLQGTNDPNQQNQQRVNLASLLLMDRRLPSPTTPENPAVSSAAASNLSMPNLEELVRNEVDELLMNQANTVYFPTGSGDTVFAVQGGMSLESLLGSNVSTTGR